MSETSYVRISTERNEKEKKEEEEEKKQEKKKEKETTGGKEGGEGDGEKRSRGELVLGFVTALPSQGHDEQFYMWEP